MHALRTLWSHGMDTELLQTVYRAVIIAKLLYASSQSILPGGAFITASDSAWKLLYVVLNALDYIQLTNHHLHNSQSPKKLTTHCFVQYNHLLRASRSTQSPTWANTYNLRSRTHNFKLSSQHDDRNFIHRMLFANCELLWHFLFTVKIRLLYFLSSTCFDAVLQ